MHYKSHYAVKEFFVFLKSGQLTTSSKPQPNLKGKICSQSNQLSVQKFKLYPRTCALFKCNVKNIMNISPNMHVHQKPNSQSLAVLYIIKHIFRDALMFNLNLSDLVLNLLNLSWNQKPGNNYNHIHTSSSYFSIRNTNIKLELQSHFQKSWHPVRNVDLRIGHRQHVKQWNWGKVIVFENISLFNLKEQ